MPHKPLQTYDRKMKRFVTASESKAVTADGISNNITFEDARKSIVSMNLIKGFLFDSVKEDEEDAKTVIRIILERVLGKKLADIEVTSQKVFN
ncbi:MAG: hypothetical protein J6Z05_03470, partial [Lachnospiraceae bacterium]|nr:hypothetical protein [Lachnospiraceae bacterium]